MTLSQAFLSLTCSFSVAMVVFAQESAERADQQPITVQNARNVEKLAELPMFVNRIDRGTKPGELIIHRIAVSARVVDDSTLKPLRSFDGPDGRGYLRAMTPGGEVSIWGFPNSSRTSLRVKGITSDFKLPGGSSGMAIHPDSKRFAVGIWRFSGGEDVGYSHIRLYETSGRLIRSFDEWCGGSLMLEFSPDGKTLVVGNKNANVRLYDVETGEVLHDLEGLRTRAATFSPDGRKLATVCTLRIPPRRLTYCAISVWDVNTGRLLHRSLAHERVSCLAWSPSGKVLVTAGYGKIVLWEAQTLGKLAELATSSTWARVIRFTSDGRRFATCTYETPGPKDSSIELWGLPRTER